MVAWFEAPPTLASTSAASAVEIASRNIRDFT
jgi:hypothetical protein